MILGRRFLPLIRLLPPEYQDGESLPRGGLETSSLPSPREISIKVHQNTEHLDKQVSLMIMQFGQYISHDISLTPEQAMVYSKRSSLDQSPLKCYKPFSILIYIPQKSHRIPIIPT